MFLLLPLKLLRRKICRTATLYDDSEIESTKWWPRDAKLLWKIRRFFPTEPPTEIDLSYRVIQAYYTRCKSSTTNGFSSPKRCGWELNGTSLDPVMTNSLPAPLALIELSICNRKGDCSTRRCKCFKNSLVCTYMSKCSACNNRNYVRRRRPENI